MTSRRLLQRRAAGLLVLIFLPFLSSSVKAEAPDSTLTIILAGDIMLGRGVKRIIDTTDQSYPFDPTGQLVRSADLAIANLESPLTTAEYRSTSPWKFRGDTTAAAAALASAGFDAVSLANNHALDCGPEGLAQTAASLGSAGIAQSGISCGPMLGPDSSVCRLSVVTVKGLRVGLLAFCEPYLLKIAKDHGAELIAPADKAAVAGSIAAAKERCDILVCSFHWGQEYRDSPTAVQKRLGRLAVDAGAKVVHGHHSHVLQGVEFYHGGLIAYSLGNFIFDQRHRKPRQSALLALRLKGARIDSVSLLPLEIVNNRPQPAELQARAILARLEKLCRKLGTACEPTGGGLWLHPAAERPAKRKRPG